MQHFSIHNQLSSRLKFHCCPTVASNTFLMDSLYKYQVRLRIDQEGMVLVELSLLDSSYWLCNPWVLTFRTHRSIYLKGIKHMTICQCLVGKYQACTSMEHMI